MQIGNLGWCLSSSEGGPQVSLLKIWPAGETLTFNYRSCLHPTHTSRFQFGQPNDVWMHKVHVENFYAENTGDDSLAFFNVRVSQPSPLVAPRHISNAEPGVCEQCDNKGRIFPLCSSPQGLFSLPSFALSLCFSRHR